MLISLNELKKYINIEIPNDKLFELIGSRLVEIESIINLSEKYKNIFIVRVEECEKIPETHLSLCKINSGKEELIQVVCGAPNVRKGMMAVWIAPGAIVPASFGEENFKIETRKLRGYESNGMLAGADELALGDDHSGIVEINPSFANPGDSFAEKFGLNDFIIEVENKSLTHRPDCFGLIGFAREIAGILETKFDEPEFILKSTLKPTSDNSNLEIKILDSNLCQRYSCAVFEFNQEKENIRSKYLTLDDIFLFKAGMRPISPLVDLTNILMLETGQPLHAFDYDKFVTIGNSQNPKIIIRAAEKDEELILLDGKNIILNENDIVITSNNVPVALAGAMGGKSTEIDATTKKIILESASFSLYNLRKTQMAHGIFSEAITRFTKGVPAGFTLPVLSEAARRLALTPTSISDNHPNTTANKAVKITTQEINSLLGSNYPTDKIINTLENVGFNITIDKSDSSLKVAAPFWRTDIEIKEDIIEEIGRLLGFDNIPLTFPTRSFVGVKIDPSLELKTELREILSNRLTANEVLTYSFVSSNLLKKANENPEDSYKLVNSLSPELQHFRVSLVPSLLEKMYENKKSGFKDFSLYEINQISRKSFGLNNEKVPIVKTELSFITFGDYYKVKNILLEILKNFSLIPEITTIKSSTYFEPLHSANVIIDGKTIATIGEIKTSVLKRFKLDPEISALTLDLDTLLEIITSSNAPKKTIKLSRFPSVSRDITFCTPNNFEYKTIESTIKKSLDSLNLIYTISPTSIYQSESDKETKNISFHLSFASKKKTLNAKEISDIIETITEKSEKLGLKII